MSFTINSLVMKVFLPIIVGVAILGVLNSIQTESLNPQVNNVQDALGQLDRTLVLGDDPRPESGMTRKEKARNEFRQAVLYNMFTAQQCEFIALMDGMEVTDQGSHHSSEGDPPNPGQIFYPPIGGSEEATSESVFTLLKTDGDLPLSCVGAGNIFEMNPANIDLFEGETSSSGNDMEGRYGRINYEVNDTFRLTDPRIGRVNFEDYGETDLYKGNRMIALIPEGMTYSGDTCNNQNRWNPNGAPNRHMRIFSTKDVGVIDQGKNVWEYDGAEHGLNAYRVRMSDVPMFKRGAMLEDFGVLSWCGQVHKGNGSMKRFLYGDVPYRPERDEMQYVMCNSSEGYIQSNAGGLEQDMEVGDLDNGFLEANRETVVFPVVQRTDAGYCMRASEDADQEEGFQTANPRNVISPRIDFEDNGNRQSCSFSEARRNQDAGEWEGIDLKCAFYDKKFFQQAGTNDGHDYFTSAYVAKDDGSCEVEDADITEMFHAQGGLDHDNVYDGRVKLIDVNGKNSVTYDLSHFERIDMIEVDYSISQSKTALTLKSGDQEEEDNLDLLYYDEISSETDFYNPFGEDIELTDDTGFQVRSGGQKVDRHSSLVNGDLEPTSGSTLKIDVEGNNIFWDTNDKVIAGNIDVSGEDEKFNRLDEIPDTVESMTLRSQKDYLGDTAQSEGRTTIESVKVTGDLC